MRFGVCPNPISDPAGRHRVEAAAGVGGQGRRDPGGLAGRQGGTENAECAVGLVVRPETATRSDEPRVRVADERVEGNRRGPRRMFEPNPPISRTTISCSGGGANSS